MYIRCFVQYITSYCRVVLIHFPIIQVLIDTWHNFYGNRVVTVNIPYYVLHDSSISQLVYLYACTGGAAMQSNNVLPF